MAKRGSTNSRTRRSRSKAAATPETENVVGDQPNNDDEILAALNEADPGSTETETDTADVDDAAILSDLEGASADADTDAGDGKVEATTTTDAADTEKVETAPAREFASVSGMDKQAVNAALAGVAKKVGEKAQNMIAAIENGKKLSRFTRSAVREIVDTGAISGKSMTERFLGEGLKEGTARAQAQQMTNLFKRLGVAAPKADDPRTLIPANATLLAELNKLAA